MLRLVGQPGEGRGDRRAVRDARAQRAFAQDAAIRQPHSIRRQHARERVDHHLVDAEGVGDQTRMLPTRAAETRERVARDIVPARDRDLADRIGHVRHRHRDEAFGGDISVQRQFGEARGHRRRIERLIALRPEQRGEEFGPQLCRA